VIDANGQFRSSDRRATVFTAPSVPGLDRARRVARHPVANGVDSVLVTGRPRTLTGTGRRGGAFTLAGSSSPAARIDPVPDDDLSAAGNQLLADSTGAVRGYVRVGTAAGPAARP